VTDRTILVVDDDDDVREITRLALEVLGGWSVTDVDRGAHALRHLREHRPAVVLLDVMMPDMDGPTVFRTMLADPVTAGIPVVLLTAKVQLGARQIWDDLPIAGVIAKPFNPTTLSRQIDQLLEQLRPPGSLLHRRSA
jgi:CheY-like chemotaxis protein